MFVVTPLLFLSGLTSFLSPADAGQVFANLEARLLAAQQVRVEMKISAEGAVEAAYQGTLVIDGKQLHLDQTGHFMEQPSHLKVTAEKEAFQYGHAGKLQAATRPKYLEEALWIGLTRMGLLHNLAMLHSGSGPDHADGGVKDWVRAHNFQFLEEKTVEDRRMMRIQFDLEVSKIPVGQATVWLDAKTGLPYLREQVVQFPEGEMVVREQFLSFEIKE